MRDLSAAKADGLLDLRAARTLRGLQGHRRAVVPGLPEALGPVRTLRPSQAGAVRQQ